MFAPSLSTAAAAAAAAAAAGTVLPAHSAPTDDASAHSANTAGLPAEELGVCLHSSPQITTAAAAS